MDVVVEYIMNSSFGSYKFSNFVLVTVLKIDNPYDCCGDDIFTVVLWL